MTIIGSVIVYGVLWVIIILNAHAIWSFVQHLRGVKLWYQRSIIVAVSYTIGILTWILIFVIISGYATYLLMRLI